MLPKLVINAETPKMGCLGFVIKFNRKGHRDLLRGHRARYHESLVNAQDISYSGRTANERTTKGTKVITKEHKGKSVPLLILIGNPGFIRATPCSPWLIFYFTTDYTDLSRINA